MAITTYNPQAKILLQTYQNEEEDLTKYVKGLSVSLSLEPPWEKWQMTLLPTYNRDRISWYERISPNDYVSIQFARFFENFGDNMRVITRGLVDAVNTSASVDSKGLPARSYVIYGTGLISKLLHITKVYYNFWSVLESLFKDWEMTVFFNIPLDGSPQDIMSSLFKIIYGNEGKSQWEHLRNTYKNLPDIKLVSAENIEGFTNTIAIGQQVGPIANIMRPFQNYPWNELFTTEMDCEPVMIFRSTPWKDKDGIYIQDIDTSKTPYKETLGESIEITRDDIISYDLNRSDSEVRNLFFTYPYASIIETDSWRAIAAKDNKDFKENPYKFDSADPDIGIKRFGYQYQEMSTPYGEFKNPKDADERTSGIKWCQKINRQFALASYQNVNYENGSFILKGNEYIRPGRYIKFGDAEYYVTSVHHSLNFVDRGRFITQCEVTRGTGFLEARKKRALIK